MKGHGLKNCEKLFYLQCYDKKIKNVYIFLSFLAENIKY